jgi:hypothetical protein
MKNLYVAGLIVVCLFITAAANAQTPITVKQQLPDKPLQFSQLPEKFECSLPELQQAASSRTANNVSLKFGKLNFDGEVVDRIQRADNVMSMNIRSTNFPGALFNIAITTQPDGTQKITGRIINPKSGDVLILTQENNRYYLTKQSQKFFMTE